MKVLIPGGHLTPALAMIDWISEHHPQVEMIFVGRKYSQLLLKQKAIEEEEVLKRGIEFIEFSSVQGANGTGSWLVTIWGLFKAIIKATIIIKKYKPSVIMSFGGYLAVPLVIAAKICRIPVVAHEGTTVLGKANQLIFMLADKIACAFPQVLNLDSNKMIKKVIVSGTPLRSAILNSKKTSCPDWFFNQENKPILLILGGNQGSLAINNFIKQHLKQLVSGWVIVHQCGRPNKLNRYQDELLLQAKKDKIDSNDYYVQEWINDNDLSWFYQNCQLAISRAGINTLEEIIYHQVPSLLIPLPHSNYKEQERNATYLQEQGAALVIFQDEMSLEKVMEKLIYLQDNLQQFKKNIKTVNRPNPIKAAQLLFEAMVNLTTSE